MLGLHHLLSILVVAAAAYPLPPISGYHSVKPQSFNVLRTSGQSALFEVVLPEGTEYAEGNVLIANLTGDREELGRAYAELLNKEVLDTWQTLMARFFGRNPVVRETIVLFLDWAWNRRYSFYVPEAYLDELRGMRNGSPKGKGVTVDQVSTRFNVLANMPARPQDIVTALEFELEKGLPKWEAALLNRVIDHFSHCSWCKQEADGSLRVPFAAGCDSFGLWGPRTQDGKLITLRNLDWNKDLGISRHKLIVVTHTPGAHAAATFGYTAGFGALAGLSERGLTVSEMNLDNSRAGFSGPPFPSRLRMLLEQAQDLAAARRIWEATNNTDSMNFMVGSAQDGKSMAIEAMRGRSAFYMDNEPIEAAATCSAVNTHAAGGCGSAFQDVPARDGRKAIGKPLPHAVWRSNHAVDPEHMRTQAPLGNSSGFRYDLLHDLILEHEQRGVAIGPTQAVSIAAALGEKGPNYLSCDPAQFSSGTHVMSVVYQPAPGAGTVWVAWEDGSGKTWRPAGCTTYMEIDFKPWWGGGQDAPGLLVV